MSTRRNTEHTKAYAETQPTFRITNVSPSEVAGLRELSVHLELTRGPLTEAHMAALYRAFLRYQDVYLVIPAASTPAKRRKR